MNRCGVCGHVWEGDEPCTWCAVHRVEPEIASAALTLGGGLAQVPKRCAGCDRAFTGLAFTPLRPGELVRAGWCEDCLAERDTRAAREAAVLEKPEPDLYLLPPERVAEEDE